MDACKRRRWLGAALRGSCIVSALALSPGCSAPQAAPAHSPASAWREHHAAPDAAPSTREQDASPTSDTPAVAIVNGVPVRRGQVVDLLLRSHGAGVLEQLVALQAAEERARKKGLSVSQADVDGELDRALRKLYDPLTSAALAAPDRPGAERLLESVLIERNISREEFLVTLRRNAYLRKIVEAEATVSDEQLRAEFDRRYGERVEVRHIQLATTAEAARVQERLATGEDFAQLAERYSANTASARNGGLLEPLSERDEEVPEAFRRAAFALTAGEVSAVVRVGPWHHLLKLERRIPAEARSFEDVRGDLARTVRERTSEARMRELYDELLREAKVEILDPTLRKAVERRDASRSR